MAEAQLDAIMFSFGIAVRPSLIPTPPLAEISQFDEHLCKYCTCTWTWHEDAQSRTKSFACFWFCYCTNAMVPRSYITCTIIRVVRKNMNSIHGIWGLSYSRLWLISSELASSLVCCDSIARSLPPLPFPFLFPPQCTASLPRVGRILNRSLRWLGGLLWGLVEWIKDIYILVISRCPWMNIVVTMHLAKPPAAFSNPCPSFPFPLRGLLKIAAFWRRKRSPICRVNYVLYWWGREEGRVVPYLPQRVRSTR